MKKKSIKSLKKKAWKLFSEWIRRRDADDQGRVYCYTCDELMHWSAMQAGHLLDGRNNSILFNVDCVRVQCPACNIWKSGNKESFIPRYIDEMGRDKFEEMKQIKNQTVKYSISDYEEMIAEFKKELEAL